MPPEQLLFHENGSLQTISDNQYEAGGPELFAARRGSGT